MRRDVIERNAVHVVQNKGRPELVAKITDLDVAERDAFRVANEEAVRRYLSKHRRFRIVRLALRRLYVRQLLFTAAAIIDTNVVQVDVFDVMLGDAGDD